MPNYTLNSIKLSGTDGVVFHPVGQHSPYDGETFNLVQDGEYTNENYAIEAYGHAEGSYTSAGWRSHTEGYMTFANNTSHAEGRCSIATGKSSHAEGHEIIKKIENALTAEPVSIENNTIIINGDVTNDLKVNDYISLAPTNTATGFKETDAKIITDIMLDASTTEICSFRIITEEEIKENFGEDYPWSLDTFFSSSAGKFWFDPGVDKTSEIRVGDYFSFGNDTTKTCYLVTGIQENQAQNSEYDFFFEGDYVVSPGETVTVYRMGDKKTILKLHAPFLAENYNKNHNGPADGVIPAGAQLRKSFPNIASNFGSHAEGAGTTASGKYSHSEGYGTEACRDTSHAEGANTKSISAYSHTEGNKTQAGIYIVNENGEYLNDKGEITTEHKEAATLGKYSHAEGRGSKLYEKDFIDNTTIVQDWKKEKFLMACGEASHAEGKDTFACGEVSHAEGRNTLALGKTAHAQNTGCLALGDYTHSEGSDSEAIGACSHAEGRCGITNGDYSHAEGLYSIANGKGQHVQGRYNLAEEVSDPNTYGKYAHIVGNGTGTKSRSNCHTLDWNGNAWYQGTVECDGIILKSPNGTRYKFTVDDDVMLNITGVKL